MRRVQALAHRCVAMRDGRHVALGVMPALRRQLLLGRAAETAPKLLGFAPGFTDIFTEADESGCCLHDDERDHAIGSP